jgi:HK97 family phage portal protein
MEPKIENKLEALEAMEQLEEYFNVTEKDLDLSREGDAGLSSAWTREFDAFAAPMVLKSLFHSEDWVYIIVDLIAQKLSNQRMKVFKKTMVKGKAVFDVVEGHPVQKRIDKPNTMQDYHAWIYNYVVEHVLMGNCMNWDMRANEQLIILPSELMLLDFSDRGKLTNYVYTPDGVDAPLTSKNVVRFKPKDIIHSQRPNPSSRHWGLSPFVPGRMAVLFNRHSQEYLNNFYLKQATPSLALEMAMDVNERVALRLLRSFEKAYTGRGAQRRTMVLPRGVSGKPMSHSPADQKLIELIGKNREVILALLKVPKHELSLATAGSLGSEEAKLAIKNFWASTLKPTGKQIGGALTRHFQETGELSEDEFIMFDLSDVDVLHEDQLKKAELAEALLKTHSINEVRAKMYDMEPHEDGEIIPGIISLRQGDTNPSGDAPDAPEEKPDDKPDDNEDGEDEEGKSFLGAQATKDWFDSWSRKADGAVHSWAESVLSTYFDTIGSFAERSFEVIGERESWEGLDRATVRLNFQQRLGEFTQPFVKAFTAGLEAGMALGYASIMEMPSENVAKNMGNWSENREKNRRSDLIEYGIDAFRRVSRRFSHEVAKKLELCESRGLNIKESQQYVKLYFDEIAKNSIKLAEHDIRTAVSIGQWHGTKDVGYDFPTLKKIWISRCESYGRESHKALHGKTIGLNERFSNGLLFARDPSGPFAEVAHCKCSWAIMVPNSRSEK